MLGIVGRSLGRLKNMKKSSDPKTKNDKYFTEIFWKDYAGIITSLARTDLNKTMTALKKDELYDLKKKTLK